MTKHVNEISGFPVESAAIAGTSATTSPTPGTGLHSGTTITPIGQGHLVDMSPLDASGILKVDQTKTLLKTEACTSNCGTIALCPSWKQGACTATDRVTVLFKMLP